MGDTVKRAIAMNINEIIIQDDEGQPFCPYEVAKTELAKATPESIGHAGAAAVCLELLATEIRRLYYALPKGNGD